MDHKSIGWAWCLGMYLMFAGSASAEFAWQWQGTRPWAGPQAWASPMYDWRVEDGQLIADAGPNRLLQQVVWRVTDAGQGFELKTSVKLTGLEAVERKAGTWAGFAIGIQGLMDDPRHVLVGPKRRINAGINGNGHLFVGNNAWEAPQNATRIDITQPVELTLAWNGERLKLTAVAADGAQTSHDSPGFEADKIVGNIALAAMTPEENENPPQHKVRAHFASWSGSGDALGADPSNAFGPILWSQYTRQGNDIKLLAMLAPLGDDDPKAVSLEIMRNARWETLDTQDYDPLTYSALLRGTIGDGSVDYRVRYRYLDEDHFWQGRFIPDPATEARPLKIGVFSCDHGYAFPLPTMVRNVKAHDPNLLFFAGDQIYEGYGGFKLQTRPTERAMADYLRKYYQFGWTWRELLKDRPSVIIPDDHDVFQGNLWGEGGRPARHMDDGGYTMPPAWVNGVQRTQTAHLPDPHDPTPVARGIGVYYTAFSWGGVPIAVIEDRKWKSGPNAVLPKGPKQALTPEQVDPQGAELLGPRQEAFLSEWAKQTADAPLRFVFSQTIFCKAHTHTGPQLRQNHYDWDSNGWPRSGRQRALRPFRDGRTVMLHGDQHLGLLTRQGIDAYNDGPYAFMVPGTSNGWPRAWWPHEDRDHVTGEFTDVFGNRFTVLAAANPEPGTNQLKTREQGDPETAAHRKGSGYGLVVVDPQTHAVTFNMYRYRFDATAPKPGDQFPGFPVTIAPR